MQKPLQLEVGRGGGFSAIAGRALAERVLRAGAETLHVPGQPVLFDFGGDPVVESDGERHHLLEIFRRQNICECGAYRGKRQRVAGECAADPADVAILQVDARRNPLRHFLGAAVRRAGNAAADRFPKHQQVRLQLPRRGAAARPRANRMRLIGDEERAVALRQLLRLLPVPVVGEDDADVGHRRLGQDAGDVVVLQRVFQGIEIVEFNDARSLRWIDRWTDVAAPRADDAVFERRKRFVHCAVVTVVKHENLCALRDFARNADGKAISVGGGESELPVGEAETLFEIFADEDAILGGQHQRDALFHALGHRLGHDVRRMAGHCAGIAQAQIHVLFSVGAGEMRAFRFRHKNRKFARPLFHPVHRNAAEERLLRALVEFRRTRMFCYEAFGFALLQRFEFFAIDCGHLWVFEAHRLKPMLLIGVRG